ncbi:MAG: hypothetical protein COB46_06575 [Rhodospirillaceae bacterium]|nr:MAG: hypothetical protein COB46_06575 [Rhodospirillaceae bacterium]
MNVFVDGRGFIRCGENRWPCAVGRSGLGQKSKEGDGLTPLGTHAFGRVFWRQDRIADLQTVLTTLASRQSMGWCDDPSQDDYNTLITLPHLGRFEELWRQDHIYDLVVEILYNTNPIISGQGSAIFMHIARPDLSPTEGCIALKQDDLLELLRMINENSRLIVGQK